MFGIKALLLITALQFNPIRIVYSYDIKTYDSLEIIVNRNQKTIHRKNYRLLFTFDSTVVGTAKKEDTVEVILRGYKKDFWCIPYVDRIKHPFRMSYGLNFECIKLVM